MKTFSVAVAVAVLLAFICLQESSAVPVTEVDQLEEPMSDDGPAVAHKELSEGPWKMPDSSRNKQSPTNCRFCCRCCPNMIGCGVCCRF